MVLNADYREIQGASGQQHAVTGLGAVRLLWIRMAVRVERLQSSPNLDAEQA